MAMPPQHLLTPPFPHELPRWWKPEFDHLMIYARHSPLIPANQRSNMSLLCEALRSMFGLRLGATAIKGVEQRYSQLHDLAPWIMHLIQGQDYGWANEFAWQDLLGILSQEVSRMDFRHTQKGGPVTNQCEGCRHSRPLKGIRSGCTYR